MRWRTALIGALILGIWGPAAPVRAEGSPAPADSARTVRGGLNAPTAVMARSLLVPGWGQAKNGAWWKAILVAGLEGAFLERIAYENRMAHRYDALIAGRAADDPDLPMLEAGARRHRSHRRDFVWWTSMLVILSMGDAYADAHLRRFDVRVQDDGDDQAGAPGRGAAPRVEVGLAWRW